MMNTIIATQTIKSPNTAMNATPPVINTEIAITAKIAAIIVKITNNIISSSSLIILSIKGGVNYAKRKGNIML